MGDIPLELVYGSVGSVLLYFGYRLLSNKVVSDGIGIEMMREIRQEITAANDRADKARERADELQNQIRLLESENAVLRYKLGKHEDISCSAN
ncbi:hypothetical protein CASP1_00004 [Alcaligenes phage CASP1]|nr:hypothetical protein CASP1_00004 [Alcaligenes phage CASP1]